MVEKSTSARLCRAVKENNLFLVKRLIQRTDIRNPDTSPQRYTSLAWAAILGHEETFEFLLSAGHDDDELSRDSENNTILMMLADQKPSSCNSYGEQDKTGAYLRMAQLYYDRYSWILDWSNMHGKTALHIAALKGNEELVRMLCGLGADFDLSDNKGNTPLHYASSWGHISIVQLLIERGCQYSARNNQGFTASDYAYSYSTRDTLQDTARIQFENNKKQRRNIFAQAAQAAAKANDWYIPGSLQPPSVPAKDPLYSRMRSGSGTSRTTATSDSGDLESLHAGQLSSSPSQPSTGSSSVFLNHLPSSSGSVYNSASGTSKGSMLSPPPNFSSGISPIASRMRERDADAMERYLNRTRSGSQGTSSTENRSQSNYQYATAGLSVNGDDVTTVLSGATTPRILRSSASAAQLRMSSDTPNTTTDSRNRSDTSPSTVTLSPLPTQSYSTSKPSFAKTLRSIASMDRLKLSESTNSHSAPPENLSCYPEPPTVSEDPITPPANGRRKAFHILAKPLQSFEAANGSNHRRGVSSPSTRGS